MRTWWAVLALFCSGCVTAKVSSPVPLRQRSADLCLSAHQRTQEPIHFAPALTPSDVERLRAAPAEAQAIARVAIALGAPLPQENTPEAWRALGKSLLERIALLDLEVTAAWTTVDCLGDQIEDLRMAALRKKSDRELRWSVLSLVTGGAGAVAGGILDLTAENQKPTALVSIGAGVITSGLAAMALTVPIEKIRLRHERNPLRALWLQQNDGHVIPGFIWNMLQLPAPGTTLSPREVLVMEWKLLLEEETRSENERAWLSLLLGDGGDYALDQLELREAWLDLLETEVQALHQALFIVSRTLRE